MIGRIVSWKRYLKISVHDNRRDVGFATNILIKWYSEITEDDLCETVLSLYSVNTDNILNAAVELRFGIILKGPINHIDLCFQYAPFCVYTKLGIEPMARNTI